VAVWSLSASRGGSVDEEAKFTWVSPGLFRYPPKRPFSTGNAIFNDNDGQNVTQGGHRQPRIFARRFFPGAQPDRQNVPYCPEARLSRRSVSNCPDLLGTRGIFLYKKPGATDGLWGPQVSYPPGIRRVHDVHSLFGAALDDGGGPCAAESQAGSPGTGMQFEIFQQQISDSLMRRARLLAALSGLLRCIGRAACLPSGFYGVLAYNAGAAPQRDRHPCGFGRDARPDREAGGKGRRRSSSPSVLRIGVACSLGGPGTVIAALLRWQSRLATPCASERPHPSPLAAAAGAGSFLLLAAPRRAARPYDRPARTNKQYRPATTSSPRVRRPLEKECEL